MQTKRRDKRKDRTMGESEAVKYPNIIVQLSGADGNAYAILGRVQKAMKEHGISLEERNVYFAEATSGDYDDLLQVTMKWVDVR